MASYQKKSGRAVDMTNRGKAPRSGQSQMLVVFLLPLTLIALRFRAAFIESGFAQHAHGKLAFDKTYHGDKLDNQLLDEHGVERISPHRKGRKKGRKNLKIQDSGG